MTPEGAVAGISMFGRECREFYWNRRRRTSARQEDCIIEESSEQESDEEKTGGKEDEEGGGGRYRAESSKRKSVSRSSSGIGTLGTSSSRHSRAQRKVSSDETSRSSRCFSPSSRAEISGEVAGLSDNEKDLNDNYEEEDIKEVLYKGKNRMKQLADNKFGSLKNLKKALSKKSLFKNKKKDEEVLDERFDPEPKTPVLGKYGRKSTVSNQEDDFGSFTEEEQEEEEEDSYSLSDFEEPETAAYEERYSRVDKLRNIRSRSKSYGNVSHGEESFQEERKSSRPRHRSGTDKRSDVTQADVSTQYLSSQYKYWNGKQDPAIWPGLV